MAARERKRHGRFAQPLTKPERALSQSAEGQARQLRREHRALYIADARRFRRIVRAAQSTVFRQNPGPKPDRQAARRISRTARKLAPGREVAGAVRAILARLEGTESGDPRRRQGRLKTKSEQVSPTSSAAGETQVSHFSSNAT
jgi:hypothetical protein